MPVADLIKKPDKTAAEEEFLAYYKRYMPVGSNPCTVNRIAWLFEDTFQAFFKNQPSSKEFDYSILKSGVKYSRNNYRAIEKIKTEYDDAVKFYQQSANKQRLDKDETSLNRSIMLLKFRADCEKICPNEKELCDIVIDLCYSSARSRQFAWDICKDVIISNLLEKNNHMIHYPVLIPTGGEFEFAGEQFIICKKQLKGNS